MKKSNSIIVAIVIIILLAVGAYAISHKSDKTASSTTSSTPASNNTTPDNSAVVLTKTSPELGQYLTDPSGKALYTYDNDTNGVSNCSGSCLANWPAYATQGSAQNLPSGIGIIKRTDNGQTQYTYNGMPLYYFVSDTNGQVTGNGVENFHVAKPTTSSDTSSNKSTTSQPLNSTPSQSSNSSSSYPY